MSAVCRACGNGGSDVKERKVPAVRGFPAGRYQLHKTCAESMALTEQEVRDDAERGRS